MHKITYRHVTEMWLWITLWVYQYILDAKHTFLTTMSSPNDLDQGSDDT